MHANGPFGGADRAGRMTGMRAKQPHPSRANSRSARQAIRSLPMATTPPPIRVNRAPALTLTLTLTLWATLVAERLDHPPEQP